MKLKSPVFWVYLTVILYLVSMLVFVSVQFFGGADVNKISAFGSVLCGVGTFFTAFVAIWFFNDWKDEKRYDLNKELAIKALSTLLDFTKSYCYYLDELALDANERNSKIFNVDHLFTLKNQFYDEYGIYNAVNSKKSLRIYEIPCKTALDDCYRLAELHYTDTNRISEIMDDELRAKTNDASITETIEALLEAIKVK